MARELWLLLGLYLLAVNLAAFAMMGLDKGRARRGRWRIPEKRLFLPVLLGGGLGVCWGCVCFTTRQGIGISAMAFRCCCSGSWRAWPGWPPVPGGCQAEASAGKTNGRGSRAARRPAPATRMPGRTFAFMRCYKDLGGGEDSMPNNPNFEIAS